MNAAPARRIVAGLDVEDHAAKQAADAPDITGAQLDALRRLWVFQNAEGAAPTPRTAPSLTIHNSPHRRESGSG
jgi:hypothetical protein